MRGSALELARTHVMVDYRLNDKCVHLLPCNLPREKQTMMLAVKTDTRLSTANSAMSARLRYPKRGRTEDKEMSDAPQKGATVVVEAG
jgi:hypothetical protein